MGKRNHVERGHHDCPGLALLGERGQGVVVMVTCQRKGKVQSVVLSKVVIRLCACPRMHTRCARTQGPAWGWVDEFQLGEPMLR